MLGPVRLAWWRERLEDLDGGKSAPAEPRLLAVKRELLAQGISGGELTRLEDGWLSLFEPFPWTVETSEAVWFRGRSLFHLGARVLGHPEEAIQSAGGIWALVDAARHCSDMPSRMMLLEQGRTFARGLAGVRFAWSLRPLSMLAALAVRDLKRGEPFEPEGTPGRAAAMLAHRFSGRIKQP